MPISRCPQPADFAHALAGVQQAGSGALFLFFGSEDAQTGQSWCPDCVTADPVLRAACARLRPDLVLHECPVGMRSDWKNRPEHPYRTHPVARVARIPTLLLIENGCERGRLVEGDCARADQVAAFLTGARPVPVVAS